MSPSTSTASATTKFPSATFTAVCPLVPVTIKTSSLASQVRLSPAVPLYNTTSWPEPSVPTVRVASNCIAPSISTTSKLAVPFTSMSPSTSTASATTKFPSATFTAVCPLVPVTINTSSLASQVRLSPDVPLYNTTS